MPAGHDIIALASLRKAGALACATLALLAGCASPPPPRGPIEPPAAAPEPEPAPESVAAPAPPPPDTSLGATKAPATPAPRVFPAMRAGDSTQWLEWEKQRRNFLLHVPPGYDGSQPMPLVIVLHGRGSSMQAARVLGFSQRADTAKHFVVYPEAIGTPRIWNAGFDKGRQEADDAGYLEALVGTLAQAINIDLRRVYLVGYSSGGMIAYRVAAQAPHLFAGVATVGATIGARDRDGKVGTIAAPVRVVPVMHIHGALDRTVPYKGGRSATIPGADYLSARESFEFWAASNRCLGEPRVTQIAGVQREVYVDCEGGAHVELVTIQKGGAEWPRTLRIDPKRPPSIVDTIWDFFTVHSRQ